MVVILGYGVVAVLGILALMAQSQAWHVPNWTILLSPIRLRNVLVLTVVMIVTYVFVGWLHDLARARRRKNTKFAQAELSVLLFSPDAEAAQAADRLGRATRNLVLDMVQRLASDLSGDADRRLRHFVLTAGLTRKIRRRLRSRSWRRRAQGAALGSLLPEGDPLRTVLLDDPHPVVRARVAEGLDESDAVASVDRLIELLDDEVPAVRFASQQALLRSGARVVPALEQYLSRADGPGIVWALEIATNLPDPRLQIAVRRHLKSTDPRRRAGATEAIVPWLQDPRILIELFADSDAEVRATAARAAGAANAEQLAAHVGRLLCDSDWNVRQQAGLTLAAMGPVGLMTLRVHLDDPDRYARDMAVLMLDTLAARDTRSRFRRISELAEVNAA